MIGCAVMGWRRVAALLAVYGFVKEIRPSEPYITPFFTGADKNFTSEQVNQEIYPVSTYANFTLLIVIFLVTDYLRYKPVLVAQGISGIAVYSMIIWGSTIPVMQGMEVLYGFMWAADVSYFTYMFSKVGRERFSDVAATARVGYLLGRFSSGVISQATVSTNTLTLMQLQYATLAAMILSTVLAVVLPGVKTSVYFHKKAPDSEGAAPLPAPAPTSSPSPTPSRDSAPSGARGTLAAVARLLWTDFRDAYSQSYVLKWSLWWSLATAGQMMVLNYVQILWEDTQTASGVSDSDLWNGAVEAAYTLFGAGAAWVATRGRNYRVWGDAVLAVWSLAAGGLVLAAATASNMIAQYCLYAVFGTIYHGAITVASSEVAQHIRDDSHALVYGINMFAAMLVQTVLTAVVVGKGGLELAIRPQFYVYGGYFLVLGVAFVIAAVVNAVRRHRRPS